MVVSSREIFYENNSGNINKKYIKLYGITIKELKNNLDKIEDNNIDSLSGLFDSIHRKVNEFGIDDIIGFLLKIEDIDKKILDEILIQKLTKYNNIDDNIKFTDEYINNLKTLSKSIKFILEGNVKIDTIEDNIEKTKSGIISILEEKYGEDIVDYENILEDTGIMESIDEYSNYPINKLPRYILGNTTLNEEILDRIENGVY